MLALSDVESAVGLSAFVLQKGPLSRKKMCYIIGQLVPLKYTTPIRIQNEAYKGLRDDTHMRTTASKS